MECHTARRASLEQWFDSVGIRPRVFAELDDAALLNVLGEEGVGVFAAPDVIIGDLLRRYDVRPVGGVDELSQSYYAISMDRKIRHPAVAAICEAARQSIFS